MCSHPESKYFIKQTVVADGPNCRHTCSTFRHSNNGTGPTDLHMTRIALISLPRQRTRTMSTKSMLFDPHPHRGADLQQAGSLVGIGSTIGSCPQLSKTVRDLSLSNCQPKLPPPGTIVGFTEVRAPRSIEKDQRYTRGWMNRESGKEIGHHMTHDNYMIAHTGHHPSWAVGTVFVDPVMPAPRDRQPTPQQRRVVECMSFE